MPIGTFQEFQGEFDPGIREDIRRVKYQIEKTYILRCLCTGIFTLEQLSTYLHLEDHTDIYRDYFDSLVNLKDRLLEEFKQNLSTDERHAKYLHNKTSILKYIRIRFLTLHQLLPLLHPDNYHDLLCSVEKQRIEQGFPAFTFNCIVRLLPALNTAIQALALCNYYTTQIQLVNTYILKLTQDIQLIETEADAIERSITATDTGVTEKMTAILKKRKTTGSLSIKLAIQHQRQKGLIFSIGTLTQQLINSKSEVRIAVIEYFYRSINFENFTHIINCLNLEELREISSNLFKPNIPTTQRKTPKLCSIIDNNPHLKQPFTARLTVLETRQQAAVAAAAAMVSTAMTAAIATITAPATAAAQSTTDELQRQISVDSNTSGHSTHSRTSNTVTFHRKNPQLTESEEEDDYVLLAVSSPPTRLQLQNIKLIQHFLRIYTALRVPVPFKSCRSNRWEDVNPQTGYTNPSKKYPRGRIPVETLNDMETHVTKNGKSTTAVAWRLLDMHYETEKQQNELIVEILKEGMKQSRFATTTSQNGQRFFKQSSVNQELQEMTRQFGGAAYTQISNWPDIIKIKEILQLPKPQASGTISSL